MGTLVEIMTIKLLRWAHTALLPKCGLYDTFYYPPPSALSISPQLGALGSLLSVSLGLLGSGAQWQLHPPSTGEGPAQGRRTPKLSE